MNNKNVISTITSNNLSKKDNSTLMQDYIKYLKISSLSDNTIRSKKSIMFELDKFCNKPFSYLTQDDIKKYITYKIESQSWKKIKTYTVAITHLNSFFNYLIYKEVIAINPVYKIKIYNKILKKSEERNALSEEEIKNVCKIAQSPNTPICNKTLFFLFLSTGARSSEIMQIKKEHVDLTRNLIYLPKEITKGKIKSRLVPISPKANIYIKEYIIKY